MKPQKGKNEDSIRKRVATGSSTNMSTASYVRDVAIEQALMIWLEDTTQKRIPVDIKRITQKALNAYEKCSNSRARSGFNSSYLTFDI
ncbi:hypothetical protein CEXT_460741 [Caerostris extrusa]|uniref:HTH CENPB-type domain-containing protein n=1 Tax=Caerostris extrusa TaxID=172846 RepID=A0AAV4VTS4_CAEEX|nr:hypothetical protein CEXT_460741 [Caerostris extrusa]